MLLSAGFSTYVISSGALIVIGFMVENAKMDPLRMAIFYFATGILGNLFSVCIQDRLSVGCLPAVMALTSGLLASVIVNWKALRGAGMMRICLIAMSVMIFVCVLMVSLGSYYDDWYDFNTWESTSLAGEAGGYIAGLCLGMVLMPHALQRNSKHVKLVRMIGVGLTFVYIALMVPLFICVSDV